MTQNIKYTHAINLLSRLSEQGKNVFTIEDARAAININKRHLDNLLQSLVEKKWLERIEKGKYLIIPLEAGPGRKWSEEAFVVASHLVDPYAISYWSALNYWHYTEQISTTVFIETTKRKTDKVILGVPFKFVFLQKRKLFGLTDIWFDNKKVQITDKEKTIIDCLDHPEHCGGIIEAAKGLFNSIEAGINLETITDYAERLNNSAVFKRLGYLSEIFNLPVQNYANKWQEQISSGYSLLDPAGEKTGRYYSRWNLRLNVSETALTSWRGH